jgi:hypothetical protein
MSIDPDDCVMVLILASAKYPRSADHRGLPRSLRQRSAWFAIVAAFCTGISDLQATQVH